MTDNDPSAYAETPPDYQFEALLDAYDNAIMAESSHWDVDSTPEREALIEHVSLLQAEIARLKARQITPEIEATKFEVLYDPLNKRYDIVVPLPSNRQVRKPILNGCINIHQQQTVLDVKRPDIATSQLKDLIAYYQGLLSYVKSKQEGNS